MKKIYLLILSLALGVSLGACSKNDPIVFDGSFAYVADENGYHSSSIDWESNKYLATYFVHLSTTSPGQDVEIQYELRVGDGLTAGVDFKHIASTSSPLHFADGIYKMPIRIEWLQNPLDATKDNTLQIVLTKCSDPNVVLGKPGPDLRGSRYVVTKQ